MPLPATCVRSKGHGPLLAIPKRGMRLGGRLRNAAELTHALYQSSSAVTHLVSYSQQALCI